MRTENSAQLTSPLVTGRSLTLHGRSSPTGSSVSCQSLSGVQISSTHSLSLPNLQQHYSDATSFINDAINTEWVSLMTSMNLGEVGDVDDTAESRSVMTSLEWLSIIFCVNSNLVKRQFAFLGIYQTFYAIQLKFLSVFSAISSRSQTVCWITSDLET